MTVHRPIDRLTPLAPRLSPLIGKLGSPHDGEVVAAARAIGRLLNRQGLSLTDLGQALVAEPVERVAYAERDPPEDWRAMASYCASRDELLTPKEADFIGNLRRLRPGARPSPKQQDWLRAIFDRLHEASD
jgi:hypothetical protein